MADPMEVLDKFFEDEFQAFMRGSYSRVKEEEWERYYAQRVPHPQVKKACKHGKTLLTCPECYFSGPN